MAITALAKHGRVAVGEVGYAQRISERLGQVHENAVGAERHVGATLQVLVKKPRRDYEEPGERAPRGLLDRVQWCQFLCHRPSLVACAEKYSRRLVPGALAGVADVDDEE